MLHAVCIRYILILKRLILNLSDAILATVNCHETENSIKRFQWEFTDTYDTNHFLNRNFGWEFHIQQSFGRI